MSTTSAAGRAPRHPAAFKTIAGIAATAVAGIAITSGGVYALLRAQAFNSTPEQISSGTLLLTLGSNGTGANLSAGFNSNITAMAPGDVVNRYVSLTNGGTLDGANLVLQLSDQAAATALTTDATKGLQVTVQSCSVAWTVATAACSGTPGTPVSQSAASFTAAAGVSLGAGTFAATTTQYFKVGVTLPSSIAETATNGTLPPGTMQGLTSLLRWTFSIDQRAATTTNS